MYIESSDCLTLNPPFTRRLQFVWFASNILFLRFLSESVLHGVQMDSTTMYPISLNVVLTPSILHVTRLTWWSVLLLTCIQNVPISIPFSHLLIVTLYSLESKEWTRSFLGATCTSSFIYMRNPPLQFQLEHSNSAISPIMTAWFIGCDKNWPSTTKQIPG